MDEFDAAVPQALKRGDNDYILPVMMGGPVHVPSDLLSPAIGFLQAEDHSAEDLAEIIARRVRAAQQRQEPRDVAEVMEKALQVRLPRIAPVSFSPYDALEAALARVSERFKQESAQLEAYGFGCRVKTSEFSVDVRVETGGQQICGLRVRFEDSFGDDRLAVSFAWPRITK